MLDRRLHRRVFLSTGLLLAALAWTVLWTEQMAPGRPWAGICGPSADGPTAAVGWATMITAMMLPTILPILMIQSRLAGRRWWLVAWVIVGYLLVWIGFGAVAQGLARLVPVEWVLLRGRVLAAGLLALAGAFQFFELKRRCLDRCRMPMGFVVEHWRARSGSAFRLGWRHGLHCLGCCWALMLLMFVVGTGGLGWMLALGLVMAVEKNMPWGRRISAPLGVGLLMAAAWVGLAA